jgi:hypothetical protein
MDWLTYGQLDGLVKWCGLQQMGVKQGDRVAIMLCPQFIIAAFATWHRRDRRLLYSPCPRIEHWWRLARKLRCMSNL